MHGSVSGFIATYGELAFAIVCTFWISHEVTELWKKWKARRP